MFHLGYLVRAEEEQRTALKAILHDEDIFTRLSTGFSESFYSIIWFFELIG